MEILHSKILGKGKPFIILHGFLGMSDNWKTLGSKYAENGFEVHLIDQRNHGKSFHSDEFNYDLLSDDAINYESSQHRFRFCPGSFHGRKNSYATGNLTSR